MDKRYQSILTFCLLLLVVCLSHQCKPATSEPSHLRTTTDTSIDPSSIFTYKVRMPSTLKSDSPLLILIHGRGSNEQDLHRFSEAFTKEMVVVSPRASISLGSNRYSWYHMDRSSGSLVYDSQSIENASKNIFRFTEAIVAKYSLEGRKVYIGGFSQGGVLSLGTGLRHHDYYDAILCWSGQLYDEFKLELQQIDLSLSPKIFISHGNRDDVLPANVMKNDIRYLKSLGFNITEQFYESEHTISRENYQGIVTWIGNQLE